MEMRNTIIFSPSCYSSNIAILSFVSKTSPLMSFDTYHESFVEIRSKKIIHKLFVCLVLCSTRLIFENYIVIPPTLDIEVFRIQKRITASDIELSLLLFLGSFFGFLVVLSPCYCVYVRTISYLFCSLLGTLALDLF
jgi:hypothetical protein